MVSIRELRRAAAAELEALKSDSPLADVDYLLMHLLGLDKTEIVFGDKLLDDGQKVVFDKALDRLCQGEPVQYVAGGCEFMSLWFGLSRDTLIPRADTEILVEKVIELCRKEGFTEIFEIGSGSGCIAASLAYYLHDARVLSVDISEGAATVATENARKLGVDGRCRFEICDIMKALPNFGRLPQAVVSNPPYIPKRDIEGLDRKVKSFEPVSALEGGEDGLDFYRRIAKDVPVAQGGLLAFEVGIGQAKKVSEIMAERFCNIEVFCDLSGIERVVVGWRK